MVESSAGEFQCGLEVCRPSSPRLFLSLNRNNTDIRTHWAASTPPSITKSAPLTPARTNWNEVLYQRRYVYCLSITDGQTIWRYRPGPADERIIETGRIIVTWPVHTGLTMNNGIVHSGRRRLHRCPQRKRRIRLWKNDTASDLSPEDCIRGSPGKPTTPLRGLGPTLGPPSLGQLKGPGNGPNPAPRPKHGEGLSAVRTSQIHERRP